MFEYKYYKYSKEKKGEYIGNSRNYFASILILSLILTNLYVS